MEEIEWKVRKKKKMRKYFTINKMFLYFIAAKCDFKVDHGRRTLPGRTHKRRTHVNVVDRIFKIFKNEKLK